ncbi:Cation/H(+) antiporter 15 [Acorus gramineus]|uniref:Cation/H(+) antiporter 15 n=1 Tax=Acorus gramineus TaxID=55184 RepID=A0AAV9B3P7_ACOGR|nr:Cation/H(+) antiporter 15 [Acorus gramineus]
MAPAPIGNSSSGGGAIFNMSLCSLAPKVTNAGFWNGNPLESSFSLLMFQICLMFFVSRAVRFLLKPLRQSRMVTDTIGGIILGPTVLGRSGTAFTSIVFPASGTVVLRTTALLGMVYFIFIVGVKMDLKMITVSNRRTLIISSVNLTLPFIAFVTTQLILSRYLPEPLPYPKFLILVAATLSITGFPNVVYILTELKLLNTELGQLAVSTTMMNDAVGWVIMLIFIVLRGRSLMSLAAVAGFMAFIVCVYRPWVEKVIRETPQGGRVSEAHLVVIILFAGLAGFYFDMMGGDISDGALFVGLVTPDGPPLGSALVEKMEAIVEEVMMPLVFVWYGLELDLSQVTDWRMFGVLVGLMFTAYVGKFVGTLLPCLFHSKMSYRESLIFSLILNFRGTVEVVIFLFWLNKKLINPELFAVLMLSTSAMTAISTPLVSILQQPTSGAKRSSACAVQKCLSTMELRIVVCVHNEDVAPSLLNLLESANPTPENPICVYVVRLVQLLGRSAPIFITHRDNNNNNSTDNGALDAAASTIPFIKAFMKYERSKGGQSVLVLPFTSVAPFETMHQDVCALASERHASLVIVPFHQQQGGTTTDQALKSITPRVLSDAPCSVGIFVDRGLCLPVGPGSCRVAVFFFGGPDDREALALAGRMAGHPGVMINVTRFVPSDETDAYDDEETIKAFKWGVKEKERVVYREVEVRGVQETVEVMRMTDDGWDLVVVGRRRGKESWLTEGLAGWSEWPELGVIGDMLYSDFGEAWSMLVVQQHA